MSEDSREAQSKHDRPAAGGLLKPTPPAPPDAAMPAPVWPPAVPPAPAPAPPAVAPPPAPVPAAVAAGSLAPDAAARWAAITRPDADTEAEADTDAEAVEDDVEDEVPLTFAERLRRLSPALVILTAGSLGSLFFLFRAVTSHTTPVPVLMGAGVETGLIFGVDAVISSIATWRAANAGESGRAVLLALIGGVSYVVSLGSFAGLVVMILVLNS